MTNVLQFTNCKTEVVTVTCIDILMAMQYYITGDNNPEAVQALYGVIASRGFVPGAFSVDQNTAKLLEEVDYVKMF